ncbi:hypothetical protein KY284_036399 [Solanum tuberosum]|nr:hypothetical protein KY284_036399 [Solanum tuberosum]
MTVKKESEKGDDIKSGKYAEEETEKDDEELIILSIDKFQVKMPIDNPTNLTGDFVVKSVMDIKFDDFRKTFRDKNWRISLSLAVLDTLLPEDNNVHFQMIMMYDLLKRRINYKGDDVDALKDENKKMNEIWINYCDMSVCFGMKEFAIVTGLRCHPLSKVTPFKKSR